MDISVDRSKTYNGKLEDVSLRERDYIFLPESFARTAFSRVGLDRNRDAEHEIPFYVLPNSDGKLYLALFDWLTYKVNGLDGALKDPLVLRHRRITLDKSYIDFLELNGKVTLVGALDHFQIWNPDSFREESKILKSENGGLLDKAFQML